MGKYYLTDLIAVLEGTLTNSDAAQSLDGRKIEMALTGQEPASEQDAEARCKTDWVDYPS